MRRTNVTLIGIALAMIASFSIGRQKAADHATKLGTYESRAIAVAYAASRFNPVGERMKEYEDAKRSGDAARMKELEAWGDKQQRQLHRQGFGRVPVDDLLQFVKERLPELAAKRGVDAIVWQCDYKAESVETVDLTEDLVLLFEPSQKTLDTIRGLRERAPLDLDEIETGHDD